MDHLLTSLLVHADSQHSERMCYGSQSASVEPQQDDWSDQEPHSEDGYDDYNNEAAYQQQHPAEEEEEVGPRVPEPIYDADMVPGVNTGEDVVAFYGKYGQDSPVKFFYCNRWG